jgi:acetyl-CoA acetyltransferase
VRTDIAIAGVYATRQARRLDTTSASICLEAVRGVLDDAGMKKEEIDGIAARWRFPGGTVMSPGSADWAGLLGIPVRWIDDTYPAGVPAVLNAAAAIAAGLCNTVLVVGGQAGAFGRNGEKRAATYTRPANEFVEPWGAYTVAHFVLAAQRYLYRFGVPHEKLAALAAIVRNTGNENPGAVMYGRGPYTVDDVLAAPMVAEPFSLLEVCLANEGAAAMIITSLELARECPKPPAVVLGGGAEWLRQQYVEPVRYDDCGRVGADSAQRAFQMAGLTPADIDVVELYDVTSFEIARHLEVCGFCDEGEGADFALETGIGRNGGLPTNTDGGLLSFSHCGAGATTLRVVEAVRQLRGNAGVTQVPNVETALVTGAGSGAQYMNAMILGRDAQ